MAIGAGEDTGMGIVTDMPMVHIEDIEQDTTLAAGQDIKQGPGEQLLEAVMPIATAQMG